MRVVVVVVVAGCLFLQNPLIAQQPSPANPSSKNPSSASCGGGHTVDEYLAEKNKTRKKRNTNPLPNNICIFGWCRLNPNASTPDGLPTSHPPQETTRPAQPQGSESSSKPLPVDVCDPYSAAQDVEVGDFYYQGTKYGAALSRYESALKSKPGDQGIYLRLGKAAEKLGNSERALREYRSSIDAGSEQPAVKEARAAIARINSKKSAH